MRAAVRLLALGVLTVAASWQPRDAAAQGGGAACFYSEVGFQGRRVCIAPGQQLPYVGDGLNDRISSVTVPPGLQVTMCRDVNFSGGCIEIDSNLPDLRMLQGWWNDQVSSVAAGGGGYGRPDPNPGFGRPGGGFQGGGGARGQVCFYEHEHFRGRAFCVQAGADVPEIDRFNDRFSSMTAPPGVVVHACEDFYYRGNCVPLQGDVPIMGPYWNDRISSFRSNR